MGANFFLSQNTALGIISHGIAESTRRSANEKLKIIHERKNT